MQPTEQIETKPECPMSAKPQKEHDWLHQLVGEWTCEGEAVMGPDKVQKWKATEVVRSVGGMWVVGEGTGEMPDGSPSTTLITLGFDPQKGRYVSTFVASMMTHMWVYEGSLDAAEKVLTLDTEGPGMSPEAPSAKYQDIVELKSTDERTLTSRILGEDGQWLQIMTATYRRKGS
jgi:Protein of unknown function (DUF1579)